MQGLPLVTPRACPRTHTYQDDVKEIEEDEESAASEAAALTHEEEAVGAYCERERQGNRLCCAYLLLAILPW
jgi:hypothetical protein